MFDTERIMRVLQNLAENARKAMGKEGTLEIKGYEEEGNLILEVEDTGEGMEPEVLEHIFEPFYSSSKSGGTGLGMVIVKSIVEAHDGAIDIASTPGEGTRVRIAIPFRGLGG